MATMTTIAVRESDLGSASGVMGARVAETAVESRRARRMTPEVGRAIEMLGHAIEYLADEFALECMSRREMGPGKHPRIAAIELLKERNREIYLRCPEISTWGDRMRELLRTRKA